jgi:hypothetical protein
MAKRAQAEPKARPYPLISPQERLAVWEKARGMWKRRNPEPIGELKKIRDEWIRKPFRRD